MRKMFTLTDDQYAKLLDACNPVPHMVVGGWEPTSPQERANAAWCELGQEMGFDGMSVRPEPGNDGKNFSAELREVGT